MAGESSENRSIFGPATPDEEELPWWQRLRLEIGRARARRLADPNSSVPTIGRFDELRYQGRGGFGVIFTARDPNLDRRVALKFCLVPDDENREVLLHEARLIAQLSHRNVVTVHELGEHRDHRFFVMEYVQGETAHEFMLEKPTWKQIVDVYAGAGAGLAAAHRKGIVHGDFKPSNILLGDDDWPQVTDFGLAHREASDGDGIGRGGTAPYTAREVLDGQRADARSDQYSFCAALFRTLERGRVPFAGATPEEVRASMSVDVPEHSEDVPAGLQAITLRGLAPEPEQRYPDMDALLDELVHAELGPAKPEPDEPPAELEPGKLDPVPQPEPDVTQSSSRLALAGVPQAPPVPPAPGYRRLLGYVVASSSSALLTAALFMTMRPTQQKPQLAQLDPVAGECQSAADERESEAPEQHLPASMASQCVTGDLALSSISETLEAVCGKIRRGKLSDADTQWRAFRDEKYPEQSAEDYNDTLLRLAAQTKVVADTSDDYAKGGGHNADQAKSVARLMKDAYLVDYENLESPQSK